MMWINTKCQQWWQSLQRTRFGKYSTRHKSSSENQKLSETPRTESDWYETSSRKCNKGGNTRCCTSNGIYAVWRTAAPVLLIRWKLTPPRISSVSRYSIPCCQIVALSNANFFNSKMFCQMTRCQCLNCAGGKKFRCGLNLRRSSQQRRLILCVAISHLARILIEYVHCPAE